jgi:hypothetical protein
VVGKLKVTFKIVICLSPLAYKSNGNSRWCYDMAMRMVFLLMPCLEQMMRRYGIWWAKNEHDLCYDIVVTTPPPHLNTLLCMLQFPLYIMMVFDEWYNGVPMVYIITSSYKQHDLTPWMNALNKSLSVF